MAVTPNQLQRRDERGMYEGPRGRRQLVADLYEAYQLYDSPNAAQVLDFLFWQNANDTERIITYFRQMRRMGAITLGS
jgi:hypothetical protein